MAREIESGRERALEAERLRAFRETARQVAHELKNPLTPIRFAVAPLALYGLGWAIGAEIPSAFLLGAAMPSAFHLLILARVFDLRPHLMRLLVLGSTVPAVAVVVAATAVLR